MYVLLAGLALHLAGGFAALLTRRSTHAAHGWGVGGVVGGTLLGVLGLTAILLGESPDKLRLAWSIPYGSLSVAVDPLTALFLLPIWLVSAAAAVYGVEYLGTEAPAEKIGPQWFFYNLLVGSMVLLVLARNAVLFLTAWEVMTLASFFLVTFQHERDEVQRAGWVYLVASHLGTAFLFVLFLLLGRRTGSLDFDAMGPVAGGAAGAGVCFVLAVVGFGTKAGFLPLHVWLPEAHPAAPSHVSAVMSGVMIKMGIYGLVRVMMLIGPPRAWWGYVLVGIGISSGVLGVLFALAQHDIKRLLAWHSVENVGIIALGLGLGVIGVATHNPALAVLGFAGGLLHVVNHALFKGLLFLAAGAVIRATQTRNLEQLGGLIRKMRFTAVAFLVGSVAIVGLPPLNGFVGEFLIYNGALGAGAKSNLVTTGIVIGGAAALALIGGLAAACFAKAFGVVFLGAPRTKQVESATDPGLAMKSSMTALIVGCVGIGLLGPWVVLGLRPAIEAVTGLAAVEVAGQVASASAILMGVVEVSAIVVGLVGALALLRARLLRGRKVTSGPTWDCGYALPTARMQYTASSFAQPLLNVFAPLVRTRDDARLPVGLFPKRGEYHSHARDIWKEDVFAGLFRRTGQLLDRFRWIQQGKVQLYVLYLVVTLVALLLWKLD